MGHRAHSWAKDHGTSFPLTKKNNVFLECTRLFTGLCEFYAQYCTGKENLFNDQELL